MADITFDDIVHAVQNLTPEQKRILKQTLDASLADIEPTRENLLAEHARLRAAGAFDHVESLRNYYAPTSSDLNDEQLSALIHDTVTEWEQELDEFFRDKS